MPQAAVVYSLVTTDSTPLDGSLYWRISPTRDDVSNPAKQLCNPHRQLGDVQSSPPYNKSVSTASLIAGVGSVGQAYHPLASGVKRHE